MPSHSSPAASRADIRLSVPKEIQPSAYTSPNGLSSFLPGVIHDGEWAAIPFYRPPECVPLGFNLLDWFDGSMAAIDCPFLLEGFGIWPGTEPTGLPKATQLRGRGAVPVWFVKTVDLAEAMSDGELTILELASLRFAAQLGQRAYMRNGHWDGPHPNSHSTIVASGTLEDGRSFRFYAIEIGLEWNEVQIVFK